MFVTSMPEYLCITFVPLFPLVNASFLGACFCNEVEIFLNYLAQINLLDNSSEHKYALNRS